MERTAIRANEYLSWHRYALAAPLRRARDRPEVVKEVDAYASSNPWFDQWRELFSIEEGDPLPPDVADRVKDERPLIGWAAANAIFRARADEPLVSALEYIYANSPTERERNFRWRVVHALGRARGANAVDVLLDVLNTEGDDWVLYGIVRSLILQAAADRRSRDRILQALRDFVARYEPAVAHMRTRVLEELIEAAFVSNDPAWRNATQPLIQEAEERLDAAAREVIASRVEKFVAPGPGKRSRGLMRGPIQALTRSLGRLRRWLLRNGS